MSRAKARARRASISWRRVMSAGRGGDDRRLRTHATPRHREGIDIGARGTNGGMRGRSGPVPAAGSATMRAMQTPPTADAPVPTSYDRYRPWRRPVEIGFWVAMYLVNAMANTATVWMDIRRLHLGFSAWEPAVWEWSSALVALALVPAVVWFTRRVPLHFDTWTRALPLHVLGSLAWSALNVAG